MLLPLLTWPGRELLTAALALECGVVQPHEISSRVFKAAVWTLPEANGNVVAGATHRSDFISFRTSLEARTCS